MRVKQTVQQFIDRINLHSVQGIVDLLTEDHLFIDSWGTRFEGKKTMQEGWQTYFSLFPDYMIEIEDIQVSGKKVFIFGSASATYHVKIGNNPQDRYWNLPAAWRAIVSEGKIRQWQVYADTKKPFDIIEKFSSSPPLNQHSSK
jgi:ketosteroid isomerase-like protein